MTVIYRDYSKARIGWLPFGLTGWQAGVIAGSVLPVFIAVNRGAWASAGLLLLASVAVTLVTVVPVRGRSATGWLVASTAFVTGGVAGWTRFRSRAARGGVENLDQADLPGSLAGVEIHEGPPSGLEGRRVALIQNHAARTWAVTAAIVHPGLGMRDADERSRMAQGLADLIDQAGRGELVDEVLFLTRTVPEDGAERDQWTARHRRGPGGQVRAINNDLQQILTGASVRTETFVTVVVPETRLGKAAREAGRGIEARAQVLYGVMAEIEAQLKGGMSCTNITWLTSPELAVACRTGFAPGDRAGIVDALTAAAAGVEVNTQVPWAMAGPSGADVVARHYSHDAWNSISSTLRLPVKGALLGALAPILAPSATGERRSFLVAYPILSQRKAARAAASGEWAADVGSALREKARMRQSTKVGDEVAQVRAREERLSRGSAMTQPYAVCTVTVPKTLRVAEYGRRLDGAIRAAGFAGLRLDMAQDVAFAASVVPMGISLTRRGDG